LNYYYLGKFKKCIAHNRRRATAQNKKYSSLEEYLEKYSNMQLIAKPGGRIMKQSEKNMNFRRGDIIKCPKGIATVQYYELRHKEIITAQFGRIRERVCTKILNNTGMCIV